MPYRRHVVAVAVFVVVAVGGWSAVHWVAYLDGARSDVMSMFMARVFGFVPLGLAVLAFTIYGFLKIFTRPRRLAHVAIKVALAATPLLAFLGILLALGPVEQSYLKGFRQWTLTNVDMAAVQQWLATDRARHEGGLFGVDNFPSDWPKSLTEFKPSFVAFGGTDANELTVHFGWGVPDVTWGLVVGPPTMKMPKVGRIGTSELHSEYRLPVKAGVYVYYDVYEG
jgi:hypothetical protein